jgi:hypothetical protein
MAGNQLINPLDTFFHFGSVPPGGVVSQEVGINPPLPPPHFKPYPINRPANVSAQITNDTSGGLFKVIAITSYNIDVDFEPGMDRLVEAQSVGGSQSLAVSREQVIGARVAFSSPTPTHKYTATLVIQGDQGGSKTFLISITVSGEQWELANEFAISRGGLETWHAGHVNDILAVGYSVITASETSGVWIINPKFDAYETECISDEWNGVQMTSLAFGPDISVLGQKSVFAGCYDFETLYLLTLQLGTGTISFIGWKKIPIPSGSQGIWRIIVDVSLNVVVIACQNGVYWSPIPSPVDQISGYSWRKASGLPDGTYSGLALGPNSTAVVAAWGSDTSSGLYGIFYGNWNQQLSDLSFSRASIIKNPDGTNDATKMLRTSITSCASNRSVMYGMSGGGGSDGDQLYNVIRSQDGGQTWKPVTLPTEWAGHMQWYNNCIDVNPFDANFVAFGFSYLFISRDGGTSWTKYSSQSNDSLHEDIHVVYFPGLGGDPNALFVGSDGGIVLISGSGTFNSKYNMHLSNLQIYDKKDSASYQYPGLYVASTQDNGNIYCVVDPTAPPVEQPWVTLDDGDGGPCRFLSMTNQLLRCNNSNSNRISVATWNPTNKQFGGAQVILVDGTNDGLVFPILEIVGSPTYMVNNQLMYAVAASARQVYGLFADTGGVNMHWRPLSTLNEDITSLASGDGTVIIIGTAKGNIYSYDVSSALSTQMSVPNIAGNISEIIFQSPTLMFALHSAGFLLRYTGGVWNVLTGLVQQQYNTLEADWTTDLPSLFIATDTSVFGSTDNGDTWANESDGLPALPYCRDLRFVIEADGSKYLYLATYGRSLWRRTLWLSQS